VLTDNYITGSELKHLSGLSQIKTLKLGGNKIKTLEELKVLVSLFPTTSRAEWFEQPD
jgi:Leucine-rich repeat (LRR) protein